MDLTTEHDKAMVSAAAAASAFRRAAEAMTPDAPTMMKERDVMYRRNAAQTPRPDHVVAGGGASLVSMAASKVLDYLTSIGLYQRAERENRRFDRVQKRSRKHTTYFAAGLNGTGAMARRERQRVTGRGRQCFGFVTVADAYA